MSEEGEVCKTLQHGFSKSKYYSYYYIYKVQHSQLCSLFLFETAMLRCYALWSIKFCGQKMFLSAIFVLLLFLYTVTWFLLETVYKKPSIGPLDI